MWLWEPGQNSCRETQLTKLNKPKMHGVIGVIRVPLNILQLNKVHSSFQESFSFQAKRK